VLTIFTDLSAMDPVTCLPREFFAGFG
jgi:hypothetical protein